MVQKHSNYKSLKVRIFKKYEVKQLLTNYLIAKLLLVYRYLLHRKVISMYAVSYSITSVAPYSLQEKQHIHCDHSE